ncbi:glycosyl transferase [Sphingobium indicum IP26]|uniref:Glycosyl transferase n=2 Tax=Sphingobium indicum TaxID=332055 RepID=A0A8E0WR20_9SPHN|nr:glycosyltransferase [Sphingobium sp. HDIP04]EPR14996.1 glycosyl transferase [Sphingobium indicum IP26]EQB08655.1 glycosyl transferase [Sphingobium sp. HDIP04]KER35832.1 glycosyl transferase [Sphingobium indicum F2]
MPMVAIYRRGFLPLSETFIADHIRSLRRYRPFVMADDIVGGHYRDGQQLHLLHEPGAGKWKRISSRLTGHYHHLDGQLSSRSAGLIHAHFLQDGAGILPLALRRRMPLVVTAHGYDATVTAREHARRTEGLWYLMLKPVLMRYVDGIICVSNWIRQCLLEAGYPEGKLRVIRLGIDPAELPQVDSPSLRRGALFVGRLVEKKGVNFLLDAWAKLPPRLREEPLTIIGDGPMKPALMDQARKLGIQPVFAGPQPREAVFAAMARHRIFAMPSIRAANGDSEGLPIVLMEAQAMGMAVVAFDDGPMREAIRPGQSGLLAERRDTGSYAAHLERLLLSADLCESFGRAGREWVNNSFHIRSNMAELEDYYDEIIGRRERRH